MKEGSIKSSVVIVSSGILICSAGDIVARGADSAGELVAGAEVNAISAPSKAKIKAWVNEIKNSGVSLKPSTDPKYSEYWIEMKKKDPDPDPDPDPETDSSPKSLSIIKPLSGVIGTPTSSPGLDPATIIRKDITKQLEKIANTPGKNFANFSEVVFAEIGPGVGWADMAEPDAENVSNAELTIFAKDKGVPVPKEYYEEILKEIKKGE